MRYTGRARGGKVVRLLVTGGAGFIGSNFIRHILRHLPEHTVVNFDKLTYAGNLESLLDIQHHSNYQFVHGDITNQQDIEAVFQRTIDMVIHFAAESHVDRSILDPARFVHTNILGTQVVLEAARRHGVTKFVQVSTDEVYGTLGSTGYFTEETLLQPNSPYSASKAGADLLVRAYHETFGLPINITRCSNNYGPFQFPEKLIPLTMIRAMSGNGVPVYGDGLQVRDWLHVEDHCRAIQLVMEKGAPGEVYNVGGSNEWTNLDVVKAILDELKQSHDLIQFVTDRPGHDRRYAIDAHKIKRDLGWKPQISFTEGLPRTVKWYLEHQPWWQRVQTGEYRRFLEIQYGEKLSEP
jgi:dTDP-glucose 4,6-dehydratase